MKEQLEIEELSQVVEHEREDKIKELQQQLEAAEKEASNNENAKNILHNMLAKGEVRQEEDGSITVLHGPNVIGNKTDVDM